MNSDNRRMCINWMLDQIEAVEKRGSILRLEDSKVEVCDNERKVHCYGEGFTALAKAVEAPIERQPFIDRTDKLSFSFLNVEFFRLVPAESEADDEEQAE